MSCYCHLHTHSKHSMFDGLNASSELVARAAELGQPGIGLTDHGNIYGAAQFFKACQKHGIKGVIGMEIYEAVPHEWILERDKEIMNIKFGEGHRYFHLTVWCQDEIGWENLCAIHTKSYTENFKLKNKNQALVDRATLEQHSEGLIIGLGCMASRTNQHLIDNEDELAYQTAKWYPEVFGDRVYCEVMGNLAEQQKLIRPQRKIAQRLGVKVVATNDVHYRYQADGVENGPHHMIVQARFRKKAEDAEKSGDKSDAGYGQWYGTDEFYLKSEEDMRNTGGIQESDLTTSLEILDRVSFDFSKLQKPAPPTAPIPSPGEDPGFEAFLAAHK